MKKYTILIIIILLLLIGFGGWYSTKKIYSLQETVSLQDNKLKEQLTELNILNSDLEAKKQAISALQTLNEELEKNNETLKTNLKELEELQSEEVEVVVNEKEVKIVDPGAGPKYINLRNSIIRNYK